MDIIAATMGEPRACLSEIRMSTAKCDLCFGHGRGCAHKRIDEHEDARGNWPATPARLRDLQHMVVTRSTWARCPNTTAAESALCGAG
jgi:hypothetical protein